MPEPNLVKMFVEPLKEAGIRYIISGSVAATAYGEPRMTLDIDIVVFLRQSDVTKLADIFPSPEYYVPPISTILQEMARPAKGQFNLIHAPTALKADIFTANRDELHAWAFQNAQMQELHGIRVKIAPPEYIILRKLQYYREGQSDKHVRDIRSMLKVSKGSLNLGALNEWISRLGVEAEWKVVSPP